VYRFLFRTHFSLNRDVKPRQLQQYLPVPLNPNSGRVTVNKTMVCIHDWGNRGDRKICRVEN
jgi:hypothetical protein